MKVCLLVFVVVVVVICLVLYVGQFLYCVI